MVLNHTVPPTQPQPHHINLNTTPVCCVANPTPTTQSHQSNPNNTSSTSIQPQSCGVANPNPTTQCQSQSNLNDVVFPTQPQPHIVPIQLHLHGSANPTPTMLFFQATVWPCQSQLLVSAQPPHSSPSATQLLIVPVSVLYLIHISSTNKRRNKSAERSCCNGRFGGQEMTSWMA